MIDSEVMKRAIAGSAAAFVAIALLGCQTEPQGSSALQKSGSATTRPALPPMEPVVFVPPKSENATDTVDALKGTEEQFKDYTPNKTPAQIELRDVSVTILNKMDAFAEPVTSSTPGEFSFGGRDRTLSPDERNKVTEEIRNSATAYLEKRLRVTKDARFHVAVIVSGGQHRNQVHIVNGFDPYGIETFYTLLIDTQSKSVIWGSGREGYGKTLDAATKVVANGVPEQLDILFGIKK